MDNQQQMLWMDEDFTAPAKPKTPEERAAELEQELQQARRELADVRKELAAKVGRTMNVPQVAHEVQLQAGHHLAVRLSMLCGMNGLATITRLVTGSN